MKCSVVVDDLRSAVRVVERAVGRTASLPILSSVYIKATKQGLLLRATNLDVGIETHTVAKVEREGEVVIPATIFSTLLSTLQGSQTIHLSLQGQDLLVDGDNQKTRLKGYLVSEYPAFPVISREYEGVLSRSALQESLSRVVLAAATYTMRQELMSVSFTLAKNTVLAATDSFRLTEEQCDGRNVTGSVTVLIPVRSIQDCLALFGQVVNVDDITVTIGDGSIQFQIGSTILLSRLIEGKFPPYSDILPRQSLTQIEVDCDVFLHTLKQSKVFTGKLSDIHLSTQEGDGLKIEAKSPEIGEYSNIIPAHISGNPITIVLNWKYIIDALFGRRGKVVLTCNTSQDPIKITSEGVNGFHIIMPMRGVM